MTTKERLLAIWYGYENQIPGFRQCLGLCSNLIGATDENDLPDFWLERQSQCWGEHSDRKFTPVPHPTEAGAAASRIAYHDHHNKYTGEYGQLRRELAYFLAHELIAEGR